MVLVVVVVWNTLLLTKGVSIHTLDLSPQRRRCVALAGTKRSTGTVLVSKGTLELSNTQIEQRVLEELEMALKTPTEIYI